MRLNSLMISLLKLLPVSIITTAITIYSEAVFQKCSVKKVFLEMSQNSQENTCARVSFLIKLQALRPVFSNEFCEISKNTFSYRTPLVAASIYLHYFCFHHCSFKLSLKHVPVNISIITSNWQRLSKVSFF